MALVVTHFSFHLPGTLSAHLAIARRLLELTEALRVRSSDPMASASRMRYAGSSLRNVAAVEARM